MTATQQPASPRIQYHPDAEVFLFAALQHAQQHRDETFADQDDAEEPSAHVSGAELLESIRILATERFGLLSRQVFRHWGITTTDDFGRLVFGLVELGRMHKTDQDRLVDFFDVYRFDEVLDRQYAIDTRAAFSR